MTAILSYFDGDCAYFHMAGRVLPILRIEAYCRISASLFMKLIVAEMFAVIGYQCGEGTERGLGERQMVERMATSQGTRKRTDLHLRNFLLI